uniref:Reverse transcriptase n=1 Tax=Ditylenchus dipsaci TaxID=166011 RepID=A0A915EEP5_9BILA
MLAEEDRDSTRFLWLKDYQKPPSPDNICIYRYTRVVFGVNASPFLLSATINHHLHNYPVPLAQEIEENTYVDNVFMPASTVEEALKKYTKSKEIFSAAQMKLRDFISNNSEVNSKFEEEDRMNMQSYESGTPKEVVKVLGVKWNLKFDNLFVELKQTFNSPLTKRQVLHIIASIYDPMGWLAPMLVPAKAFLQQLWAEKVSWDVELSQNKKKSGPPSLKNGKTLL